MNILTVDDSKTIRGLLKKILESVGHNVCQAEDGVDALNKLVEYNPDVVITDLNMPNMNGMQLVRELRKISKTQYIPILFLTTEGGNDLRQEGKSVGATGWILKPFDTMGLLEILERVSA